MTGAWEQVLASISFLPIKIRIDLTSTDTEGGVKEGDGVLGGAGTAHLVRVTQLLCVFDCELDRGVDGVNVTMCSCWCDPVQTIKMSSRKRL